ncbi:class I SAM-dependent methyltransferase [Methylobacterium oryzihabitans]|uniref:Class I SAM-dependent methyltransferase n=1 Tax=Methylobacterium oryzihabitans TaxID=2499852 RepID=A0A437P134_9HYPH|nr:class I SAM-dependent methyltransferase [Methylobacterium oryzihabitans]RVU15963.1 class I SAM-dependent methyltransferase [Methylobacterium oryzihabitans]
MDKAPDTISDWRDEAGSAREADPPDAVAPLRRPEPGAPAAYEPLFVERPCCPVCASTRTATLFSAPYDAPAVRRHVESHYRHQGRVDHDLLRGVDYTVQDCADCGLIYQRMAPAGAMMAAIYDGFIDPVRLRRYEVSRLTVENFRDVARRLAGLLAVIGREPKDVSLLDYGFGYGRWARVAVGMGMRVYATEISPEKIAFARSIGVTILAEEALGDHRFDIVHTEQVFEHLPDPAGTFDRLAACVAPGGALKIAVPRQGRIRSLLRRHGLIDWSPFEFGFRPRRYSDYNCILPLEHLNAFGRRAVEALAARAGMVVTTGGFGGHQLDLDVGSPAAFARSLRLLGVRALKDAYVRLGPGRHDSGYYILRRRAG